MRGVRGMIKWSLVLSRVGQRTESDVDWDQGHKAIDLWIEAGEHGCSSGYQNVGLAYDNSQAPGGLEIDWKKAQKYNELAAIGGNVTARWRLGDFAILADQEESAVKHYMIAAKG